MKTSHGRRIILSFLRCVQSMMSLLLTVYKIGSFDMMNGILTSVNRLAQKLVKTVPQRFVKCVLFWDSTGGGKNKV